MLSAIKSLLSFGYETGYLRYNVGKALRVPNGAASSLAQRIISEAEAHRVIEREPLFAIPPGYEIRRYFLLYDVAQDDQRFLMARLYEGAEGGEEDGEANRFVLVRNFFEELKERAPN